MAPSYYAMKVNETGEELELYCACFDDIIIYSELKK